MPAPDRTSTETEHPLSPFYRAWGHRTWSRLGTLWIEAGRFSIVSVPCSLPITASHIAVERLLRETGRIAAQFPCTGRTGVERDSYWVRDRDYDLNSLQRQFRQQVSRHRGRCMVRAVGWRELAARGWPVVCDALHRQSREVAMTREQWEDCCRIADRIPHLTATGCDVDGELAAFLVSWVSQRRAFVLMYHRSSRFDECRPTHTLIAEFTRRTIRGDDIDAVTLGRDLVPRQGAVDAFKRHAGYTPEPMPVAAVLDPRWSGLLAHGWTRGVLRSLRGLAGRRAGPLDNVDLLDVAARTILPAD